MLRLLIGTLAATALMLTQSACRREPQEVRSMGQTPEEMSEKKLKPADFPAESTDKPRDLEGGEGLSKEFKETIKKNLGKREKPKKP